MPAPMNDDIDIRVHPPASGPARPCASAEAAVRRRKPLRAERRGKEQRVFGIKGLALIAPLASNGTPSAANLAWLIRPAAIALRSCLRPAP